LYFHFKYAGGENTPPSCKGYDTQDILTGTNLLPPNGRRRILLDTYNAQVDNNINSCINLALFDGETNRLLDEIVICDQAGQMDDLI
jgi:hypothetical protein